MSTFQERFGLHTESKTNSTCILQGEGYRLSLLTPCLLRVEAGTHSFFTDLPTQQVWYRDFQRPAYSVERKGSLLILRTTQAIFWFDTVDKRMEAIRVKDLGTVTRFDHGNLGGTARTLDGTIGPIPVGKGVISKDGVAVLDDSRSLLLPEDGTIQPRGGKGKDLYYFAYGHQYRRAVQDLFRLTGPVPLVPRYSLGNWWSRYKAYTQKEYMALMQRFIETNVPITVATIDMDWHWVDVDSRFGKEDIVRHDAPAPMDIRFQWFSGQRGWTGYSWNTDLFPDHKAFLQWLHEKNFKVTMNLHPACGVRFFEDAYEDMARAMGVDPAAKTQIPFDITNANYIENYFDLLHHPYEKEGVDFWWIDWQQGNTSGIPGLDPLWALNHYHTMDQQREGKRPLILSRYAGIGSHRYPLGFSGDTGTCWPCLNFQPFFTANAANAGYTWWSHDIGGHHRFSKDDELYLRWLQFGVFSPINRLHSTSNEFMGKEPWKYSYPIQILAEKYLRLRHRMIPYLYTMNARTHHEGLALCEPMYYGNPEEESAYQVPNEYRFGSELIVAPVTEPVHKKTLLAGTTVWLPAGRYTDIFTGRIYTGGKFIKMFRDVGLIPVLAREGAIFPLAMHGETNDWKNPEELEISVYRGNNTFSLYEDDGETNAFQQGVWAVTPMAVAESGRSLRFTIAPVRGDSSVLPQKRTYHIRFRDIVSCGKIVLTKNGRKVPFSTEEGPCLSLRMSQITSTDHLEIELMETVVLENQPKREMLIELISKFQCGVDYKRQTFTEFIDLPVSIPSCPKCYREPLEEILKLYYR